MGRVKDSVWAKGKGGGGARLIGWEGREFTVW